MPIKVVVSGLDGNSLEPELASELQQVGPNVVGVASAFVSVRGVRIVDRICGDAGLRSCRLVAGIDHAITHPNALALADDIGWRIRIGASGSGIFHPKFVVGGERFTDEGDIESANFAALGSANLGRAGFEQNVECTVLARGQETFSGIGTHFGTVWRNAVPLTDQRLTDYSDTFSRESRRRSSRDLEALGVADGGGGPHRDPADEAEERPENAVASEFAQAAWAGLQSFTGDFRFQVEFPRTAGEVIAEFVGEADRVDVYCVDEDQVRSLRYGYYQNEMFRLNIPNEVPGVQWARENRDGIALLEVDETDRADITLKILKPGGKMDDVVNRSRMLGTWEETSTREYGWY